MFQQLQTPPHFTTRVLVLIQIAILAMTFVLSGTEEALMKKQVLTAEAVATSTSGRSLPANLFTFDPVAYAYNGFHGTVCITNQSLYQPECGVSPTNWDGALNLGLRSSHELVGTPKWVTASDEHDNRTYWLSVPPWEKIVSEEHCLELYLPMDNSSVPPEIFVAWICECGETEHDKCLEKELFLSEELTSPTEAPELEFRKKELTKSTSESSISTTLCIIHGLYNPKGCTITSATVPLVPARTRAECLYFCLAYSIDSTKVNNCVGVFYWDGTGRCQAVIKYSSTVAPDKECEFWEAKMSKVV